MLRWARQSARAHSTARPSVAQRATLGGVEEHRPGTDTPADSSARRARHEVILADVAQEEADSTEAEALENTYALNTPLHLRIDNELDSQLRAMAATEHIPTSALVRRLLRQAIDQHHHAAGLSASQVEEIARRIAREELHSR